MSDDDRMVTGPNPYAPPAVSLDPIELDPSRGHSEEVEAQLASPPQRLANVVIDNIAVRTSAVFAIKALLPGGWAHSWGVSGSRLRLVDSILSLGIFGVYYCLFEGLTGRTIGKWITRTRVVGLQGERPTFGRVVLRSLLRMIPFEGVSFLFSEAGWHDRWSQTRVVRIPRKVSAPFSVIRVDQPMPPS